MLPDESIVSEARFLSVTAAIPIQVSRKRVERRGLSNGLGARAGQRVGCLRGAF